MCVFIAGNLARTGFVQINEFVIRKPRGRNSSSSASDHNAVSAVSSFRGDKAITAASVRTAQRSRHNH